MVSVVHAPLAARALWLPLCYFILMVPCETAHTQERRKHECQKTNTAQAETCFQTGSE